jgi:hypothetical protein
MSGDAAGRGNVLVVYALNRHPVRETIRDHLYSFARYSRHRCFYLNMAVRDVPRMVRRLPFDAVVFHTSFLAHKWAPDSWRELIRRAAPLKAVGEIRVAIPQDEFLRSAWLCEFIEEFGIGHVFSAAAESEWPKIYAGVDRDRVGFTTVLTGYLEPRSIQRAERFSVSLRERKVDIGYRAWHAAPWLGRHGQLKHLVAAAVQDAAPRHGVTVDISTSDDDVLYGDDWYRFLGSSRYTIGVEGGSSLNDRDGSIREATERYEAEHPGAGFDEIESATFPGRDGELSLFAISPRHLEACATRTCQVLIEGDYNGVLHAGQHYIPLRHDLGNLDEVLEQVRRDDLREGIVEQAYRDVVASGRYEYSSFVELVDSVIPVRADSPRPVASALAEPAAALVDRIAWLRIRLRLSDRWSLLVERTREGLARAAKRVLPRAVVESIRRRRARGG